MFDLKINGKKSKSFKTVGDAVKFINKDALNRKKDCEYTVNQENFPMSHYSRTAYDIQLEACRL